MKKLNKMELDAVARQIADVLSLRAESEQKILDTANAAYYEKTANTVSVELLALSKEAQDYLLQVTHGNDYTEVDRIKRNLHVTQTKVKFGRHGGHYEIERKLIIAQIDAVDLDDMIKKVTDQCMT